MANEHANVTVFTAGLSSCHFGLDRLALLIAPYKCKIVTTAISHIWKVCWHGWLDMPPKFPSGSIKLLSVCCLSVSVCTGSVQRKKAQLLFCSTKMFCLLQSLKCIKTIYCIQTLKWMPCTRATKGCSLLLGVCASVLGADQWRLAAGGQAAIHLYGAQLCNLEKNKGKKGGRRGGGIKEESTRVKTNPPGVFSSSFLLFFKGKFCVYLLPASALCKTPAL